MWIPGPGDNSGPVWKTDKHFNGVMRPSQTHKGRTDIDKAYRHSKKN